eukprot:320072-Chlamydomonas_euryale.AAC.1
MRHRAHVDAAVAGNLVARVVPLQVAAKRGAGADPAVWRRRWRHAAGVGLDLRRLPLALGGRATRPRARQQRRDPLPGLPPRRPRREEPQVRHDGVVVQQAPRWRQQQLKRAAPEPRRCDARAAAVACRRRQQRLLLRRKRQHLRGVPPVGSGTATHMHRHVPHAGDAARLCRPPARRQWGGWACR